MSTRHAEAGRHAGHRRHRGPAQESEGVQRITTAAEGAHVDRDARFVRYAWQMGIRTACFIGAFFTTGWLQVVLFIAAIVLPYIAVSLANMGTVSNGRMMDAVPDAPPTTPELTGRLQLGTGPETVPGETIPGSTTDSSAADSTTTDSTTTDSPEGDDRSA